MESLNEPLLSDLNQNNKEKVSDKNSVNLTRFGTVVMITTTTFILFILILVSQLPPQETLVMATKTPGMNSLSTSSPEGWKWTIYGEFQLFPGSCPSGCQFEEAAGVCEEQGGHLPFIQNQEENEEIQNILSTGQQTVWIGLVSKYRTGSWQLYKTEDAATYFNFVMDSAEENLKTGDCAVLDVTDGGRLRRTGCERRKDSRGGMIGVLCARLPNGTESMDRRVMMGKSACDDAKKDIEKDLDDMIKDTECDIKHNIDDKVVVLEEGLETAAEHCDDIHKQYVPNHICMDQVVNYTGFGRIPTHGPHRPNWASFGEYSYLPIERWQHNLEHGCVVLLHHPCLDHHQVTTVKTLLSSCLRKHIITPSRLPSLSRPVILVAWGCYLEFQFLDLQKMKSFISAHALGGPEGNFSKDGLYTHLQIAKAGVDREGSVVCPSL